MSWRESVEGLRKGYRVNIASRAVVMVLSVGLCCWARGDVGGSGGVVGVGG